MFDLFSQSDFFIAPYREVSQSGPLLRAYNYKIIPIVSDEPGFLEYVENSITGFLFKNEDCHDLARVMDEAIELSLEQRKLMLKNIEEMKELEFSIERVASKYVDMFQEIYGK
jgi:glycosyltransferase involved in cell wall biosynthesis